jgi:hypothetical protein
MDAPVLQSGNLLMHGCISGAPIDPGKGQTQFPDFPLQGRAVHTQFSGGLFAVPSVALENLQDEGAFHLRKSGGPG